MLKGQILIGKSEIFVEPGVQVAKKALESGLEYMSGRQKTLLWDSPGRLLPTQSFPSNILNLLSHGLRYRWFYEIWKALPLSQCS